jgi:hypothetical protein
VIAGDLARLEQEAIAQLQSFYKPILLVFNKTDLYSEGDRMTIYEALQNEEMCKLISPEEIVFVTSDPKPIKVRIQYSDGRGSQEIWEQPQPDVQSLKERILDLLNVEGKELLAVNVLRSLLEIQNVVTQRYLQKLQASTAIASLVFMGSAIGVLLSPIQWLDSLISISFSSLFVIWIIGKYPVQKKYLWLILILVIASLIGGLGINSEITRYGQILCTGLGLSVLFNSIITDIDQSRASGKFGAKTLIKEIILAVSEHSILRRFQKIENA